MREKFPQSRFDLVASEGTVKLKCHDCPKNLYKCIYPDKNTTNFEAHLRTPLHKQNVSDRLGGAAYIEIALPAVVKQNFKPRISEGLPMNKRVSSVATRQSLPSRISRETSEQSSPAPFRRSVLASPYGLPPDVAQAFSDTSNREGLRRKSPEPRSLVVIFPFATSSGRLPFRSALSHNSRSQSCPVEQPETRPQTWESEDRTKRRLVVPHEDNNIGAGGPTNLEVVDGRPAIRIKLTGKKPETGRGVVPAILRSTLRNGESIESLQDENEDLQLQTRALEESHGRNARLILAAEGKYEELVDRIQTLEEWSGSIQALPSAQATPEDASLSSRLALLEKRADIQRHNFTAAHQLQVSTSEEMALLRTTSTRRDQELSALNQELSAFKNTSKKEKDWRKYLDTLTKEHKTKIEQLELKLKREREDKMAMEDV